MFPEEFAKGIELLKQSPEGKKLIEEISNNPAYSNKSQKEIAAEALVTAIGNKGEKFHGSFSTKFKAWLKDLFLKISKKLRFKVSPDDSFNSFTNKV